MPLTPSVLAAAIKAAQGPAEDAAIQDDANLKLATGICNFLTANLQILTPSTVTGVVATGVGAGGAVTGTATGTGSVV